MRLTDYQRGSIFGLVITAAAFAFALQTTTDGQHANNVGNAHPQAASKQGQEPEPWWRSIVQWTIRDASGFFTLCLVGIGLGQAYLFWWQLHLIREGLTDTQEAADAAKESANVARLALEAAETPYLIAIVEAYKPEIVDYTDTRYPSATFQSQSSDPNALVSYTLKNCGRSPAILLEVYQGLIASAQMPATISFPPPQTNSFINEILEAGSSSKPRRFRNGSVRENWTPADQTRAAWLVGQTRYADVFGNQFISGFCSYRNPYSGRWVMLGGPAYNFRRKLTKEETALAIARDSLPSRTA